MDAGQGCQDVQNCAKKELRRHIDFSPLSKSQLTPSMDMYPKTSSHKWVVHTSHTGIIQCTYHYHPNNDSYVDYVDREVGP